MEPNTKLLKRTLTYVEDHPGAWKQGIWRSPCGTFACYAGWAATLGGARFVDDDCEYVEVASLPEKVRDPLYDYYSPDGESVHVSDAAAALLGLVEVYEDENGAHYDTTVANRLFNPVNSLESLRAMVAMLCGETAPAGS